MKVMVTGAGALLGQGIIRSLQTCALPVHIVAADPSPMAAGLYWSDTHHLIPMARDPGYLGAVRRILEIERPDALLVGTDVELHHFARNRALLEREHGCQVVVCPPQAVQIADDKYQTCRFLKEHGFDYPDFALPDGVDALIERVGFPLIVKPRVGARSVGVHRVEDVAALRHALGVVDDPVVQEVAGPDDAEYTAGVLCFHGVAQASIVMRRDLRDGNTHRAFVEPFPELNAQIRPMAEALGAYGPVNFQFRVDDGRAKVFEINARFSGTTPFRRLAGFNEVEMVLRHVLLGEEVRQPEIEPVTILRYLTEQVVRPQEQVA